MFVPIGGVGQSINAFGYSRSQRVFRGMRTNPLNDTLVRIDSMGVTTDIGPLEYTPPFAATRTNTGTVGLKRGASAGRAARWARER